MIDYIAELTKVLPPPVSPVGATGNWFVVENDLKLSLPDDYKSFINAYGTGALNEFLWVDSPFAPRPEDRFQHNMAIALDNLAAYHDEGIVRNPHPLFPRPGGLLPFGSTQNTDYLSWKTHGNSQDWIVVMWDSSSLEFVELPGQSLTKFILGLVDATSPLLSDSSWRRIFSTPVFVASSYGGTEDGKQDAYRY